MKVARYWARAEAVGRDRRGDSFDLSKWGWSDRSVTEAEQMARRGVEELAARLGSGEGFPDRYGYGDGRPLREEVVRTIGDGGGDDEAIITRNSYGALVLNAARAMFVDVDLPDEKRGGATGGGGGIGGFIGKLFGSKGVAPARPEGGEPVLTAGEQAAVERARAWTAHNRDWNFRVYRTAAGLRLLATHDLFDPKDREVAAAMESLGADPLYVRLCRAQECFRARLTPKPWRVGMRPPFVSYPYAGGHQENAMRQWVSKYDQACARTATCRLLTTVGSGETAHAIDGIVRLHDEETRVSRADGMPLA